MYVMMMMMMMLYDALVQHNFIPLATGSLKDAGSVGTKSSQDEND